ncbi:MAG: formimidoylglutamate deiminase [Acidobacteriota bacterium]|nr:formimidoylglutamate deiminase [Acidobacteriota bacterium]
MSKLFLPELMLANGGVHRGAGLRVDDNGNVAEVLDAASIAARTDRTDVEVVRLAGKALLPGLANAHSHTFQRLFRGRAEGRKVGGDTFWTWREQMYRAAAFVTPESLYDVARATFLEMVASGITVVGEFHYLHNDALGKPFANPNELALQVMRAAESVGIRICLLRSAYMRAGYRKDPHAGQRRFYETREKSVANAEALQKAAGRFKNATVGLAPHSIRAVPLDAMKELAAVAGKHGMPLHIHVSEQIAENEACLAEYGETPIELFNEHGLLTRRTTLIHAIHLTGPEMDEVSAAGATICSCPTTERNLGDGIFPADVAARLGISVAFGTDSQAQIDILEDARQSEYHLRLIAQQRGMLDQIGGVEIGTRLLHCATASGYKALGVDGGDLKPGQPADFFTLDLSDMALLGMDETSLASQAVFAGSRAAVRDVAVAGRLVLADSHHAQEEEIRARYKEVQQAFLNEEAQ